jgi:malonate decarboxylase gamma subunit
MSRGSTWFYALAGDPPQEANSSILVADRALGAHEVRYLAVVPNPRARFPRARGGEVGLEEGWTLAKYVMEVVDNESTKRSIVAIVDVPSQAYGRREELLGIHLACAAAAGAYATAWLSGHPVVTLIVGSAFSGGVLAHGYQSGAILALDAPGVSVHAMGKAAAARVTRRTVKELDELGQKIVPMAYDIRTYVKLGIVQKLISGVDADNPTGADIERVEHELIAAIAAQTSRDLSQRFGSANGLRAASTRVREHLGAAWNAP